MRKTRSDKGQKRGPRASFNVTSTSTDDQIKAMLKKVNDILKTYQIPSTPDWSDKDVEKIVDRAKGRVQNILSFIKGNGEIEKIDVGDKGIPLTQESIDYVKTVLKRQEDVELKQKAKDPSFVAGKKLNDLLKEFPTFSKELDKIQEQLKDPDKYEHIGKDTDVKVVDVPKGKGRIIAMRANKKAATMEMIARAYYKPTEDIKDVIQKLYEDQKQSGDYTKHIDLLDELRDGKWTGDLLDRVNLRAMGIDIDDR